MTHTANDFATAVETIVDSLLSSGNTSGTMGSITRLPHGRYEVRCFGRVVLVSTDAHGWLVSAKRGVIGADAELWLAARNALAA